MAHIDTGREMRGGQRQVLLLARGLRERGVDQVILARRDSPLHRAAAEQGLAVEPVGIRAARRADLVHAHDARGHTVGALAGRPLVVSRRVAFPVRRGVLSQWKYARAARFLAVSEFVKGQLVSAGVPSERVAVVYDGVDVRDPGIWGRRRPVAVAPASDDPQKGSALAVEACRAAGIDLQFSANLEQDLPGAALLLYLSHSEGLGSAILLAMALGTPVVASRVGGIPEVVEHEKTGLLVANEPGAVTAAIRQVRDEPQQAEQRAGAAWEQVRERFSVARMVAQTEQAYRLALGFSL